MSNNVTVTPQVNNVTVQQAAPNNVSVATPGYVVFAGNGVGSWLSGAPVETIDGVRTTFSTPNPYVTGGLIIFLNGLRESHFTEASSTTFTMSEPPLVGDDLTILYRIT